MFHPMRQNSLSWFSCDLGLILRVEIEAFEIGQIEASFPGFSHGKKMTAILTEINLSIGLYMQYKVFDTFSNGIDIVEIASVLQSKQKSLFGRLGEL